MPGPATTAAPDGVLVVDKPGGMTSHDVVSRVRRALGTREVGHAGTLDPMATGVLVVLVGQGTKLAPYLTAADKGYRATVRLGVATDSLDADGAETERRPVAEGALEPAEIERAMTLERARTEQSPPVVSAIKIAGVASHAMARRGQSVALADRPVRVDRLVALAIRRGPPELDLELVCAKGYYVRALARDLAASLGTVGHLGALRRLHSGAFTLADAVALEPLDGSVFRARLVPIEHAAARALPTVALTEEGTHKATQGKRLAGSDALAPFPDGPSAWLDAQGLLVAIGAPALDDVGGARVLRGFHRGDAHG